jgi:hypothetical protein
MGSWGAGLQGRAVGSHSTLGRRIEWGPTIQGKKRGRQWPVDSGDKQGFIVFNVEKAHSHEDALAGKRYPNGVIRKKSIDVFLHLFPFFVAQQDGIRALIVALSVPERDQDSLLDCDVVAFHDALAGMRKPSTTPYLNGTH